ncbi:MAG: LytTR family DNA-binding domain-containing protein, partial [Bacteroidota bacterium]
APAQRILKRYIQDLGNLDLLGVFTNAIDAISFLKTERVDLIFLDIHLPKMSGMDFLKVLPKPPAIILTTAFPDYALESYEFDVVDYLLKPFSFQRFVKAVSKVDVEAVVNAGEATLPTAQSLFIKSGHDHIRIEVADVQFIQSDADYTEIHLKAKRILSNESLRHWESVLDSDQFIRVHRSYLVNTKQIQRVSGNRIHLIGDHDIPIGRAYKEHFSERFLG